MDQAARAREAVALLERLGAKSALIGGLAVSLRARVRFTKDIDLAVAVDSDPEAERLAFELQRYGFQLIDVFEQEERQVLATLRFRHPTDPGSEPTLDLLFGSSGIEREIAASATPEVLAPNIVIPVARVPHLIATKVLSERAGRDQDRGDLRALITVASDADLLEAKQALTRIVQRGFHRGQPLLEKYEGFLEEMQPRRP